MKRAIRSGTTLRGVGTMLDAGWSLVFFPEGERSRTGVLLPFRQGIGIVAGAMRAPVVPVKVGGFGSVLPRDAFWPRRGTGTVVFGKPMTFNHKNLFSLLGWLAFATLLFGRWRYGWRGRRALYWVFGGTALLVLGYLGSKFVGEILLGR
mgnify:CR=1 FL=1